MERKPSEYIEGFLKFIREAPTEYQELSDDRFDEMIEEKVKNTEFVKAIVIYVG